MWLDWFNHILICQTYGPVLLCFLPMCSPWPSFPSFDCVIWFRCLLLITLVYVSTSSVVCPLIPLSGVTCYVCLLPALCSLLFGLLKIVKINLLRLLAPTVVPWQHVCFSFKKRVSSTFDQPAIASFWLSSLYFKRFGYFSWSIYKHWP